MNVESKKGRNGGVPVFIDGKRFSAKLAACIELGCDGKRLRQAIKEGSYHGRMVSLTLDGAGIVHHNIPAESRHRHGPLLVEPVTHRLGTYSGGPA
jgi:hypothetical protein